MTRAEVVRQIGPRWAVALTLLHEQGFPGDEAAFDRMCIASVIANRARTGYRGKRDARSVVLDPKQFSCWNAGTDRNHLRLLERAARWMQGGPITDDLERQALWIAEGVAEGTLPDLVQGARHYHTHGVAPAWSKGKQPAVVTKWHRYFEGIA